MKKYLFLTLFLLLVTACTPEHRLEIKGDKITETITFTVDREQFVDNSEYDSQYSAFFSPTTLNHILNDNISVFNTGTQVFERTVINRGRFSDVELTYTYDAIDFFNARAFNDCFENTNIRTVGREIIISLSGEYYCLFDENASIKFIVDTTNKVNSHNAEFATWNNYNWTINSSNMGNVNIEIKLLKQSIFVYYGVRIALVIAALVIINCVLKIMNRKSLNEV